MIKNEILKLFPEPIFKYKFDDYKDFNKELSKYIYDLYEKDKKGIESSNRGGWHSENFKLDAVCYNAAMRCAENDSKIIVKLMLLKRLL